MSPDRTSPLLFRAEAYELVVPVEPARGDARGSYGARRTLVVRLVSAEGAEGWGQAGWPAGAVLDQVQACAASHGAGQKVDGGVSFEVSGAFDLAALDLRGQLEGRGLAEMLGIPRRSEVLGYASVHNYGEGLDPGAEALSALESARARGFGGLKVKVGRGSVESEIRWLEQLRVAAPEMALMADANQTYDRAAALRMGKALEGLGAVWFEEPISREDPEGYRWLAERLAVPLAGGEDCEGVDAVEAWANTKATSIVQANVGRLGGPSALAEATRRARAHAKHFAVHCWNAPLLHAATLQCLALTDELDGSERWFAALETTTVPEGGPLLREALLLRNGRFEVPAGPGVGVQVDTAFLAARATRVLSVRLG